MADSSTVQVSIRAEAQLEAAPDEAALDCAVTAVEDDKATSLRVLGRRLDAATGAVRDLGGVVRRPGDARRALAWLVGSFRTQPERHWDQQLQKYVDTGRVIASAALTVLVRDFALLDAVGNALAGHEHVHLRYVAWTVDYDNPAWEQVRAEAVTAAVAKARHYAGALGGSLVRIDRLADVGLLGSGRPERVMAAAASPDMGDDEDGPSLDAVPQELHAGIEASFTAAVPPLS
ncbi:MAG TPA: SIMPL domain-containing protein [Jatrophihabitantaceae bacterium]|jgi:hypothetical protein